MKIKSLEVGTVLIKSPMIGIGSVGAMAHLYQLFVSALRNVIWMKLAQPAEPIFLIRQN